MRCIVRLACWTYDVALNPFDRFLPVSDFKILCALRNAAAPAPNPVAVCLQSVYPGEPSMPEAADRSGSVTRRTGEEIFPGSLTPGFLNPARREEDVRMLTSGGHEGVLGSPHMEGRDSLQLHPIVRGPDIRVVVHKFHAPKGQRVAADEQSDDERSPDHAHLDAWRKRLLPTAPLGAQASRYHHDDKRERASRRPALRSTPTREERRPSCAATWVVSPSAKGLQR
jgi:hypothetical protein